MEVQTLAKRKSDALTPPINEVQKRYMWTPPQLSQNKYYLPTHIEDKLNDNQAGESNNNPNTTVPKIKIPPIYLQSDINHKELTTDIKSLATGEFTTYCNTNSIRINLTKQEDYRSLTKHFFENKIKYHTYQNPSSKPLSVVIKNVPISLTIQEIENELKILPVIKITRLLTKDKQPLPVCAVDLTDNEDAKKIFTLKSLYYSIVTVEIRKKPTNIPQCHRCQQYFHTKNYCTLEPRCVKCAGNHLHNQCPKKKNEPLTCANCGGNHAASYRGCPHHLELLQKRIPIRPNSNRLPHTENIWNFRKNQPQTQTQQNNPSHPNHNTTNTPHPTAQQQVNNTEPNNLIKILIDFLTPLIPQIKAFITNTLLPLLFNGP